MRRAARSVARRKCDVHSGALPRANRRTFLHVDLPDLASSAT